MSGLIYFLLSNPDGKLQQLVREIRESFSSTHDITFESTANLKYLNACKLRHAILCLGYCVFHIPI